MPNIREIAQLGNPVLREQAIRITDFDSDDVKQTIADMQFTLSQSKGVGLAAPQIGEPLSIVIIASRPTDRYPLAPEMEPLVMINPTFSILNSEFEEDWEGCLSIPGIRALVPRYKTINVQYSNSEGEGRVLELDGFVARVFQHEYDHLNGLVFLDKVENNSHIISESEFLKLFDSVST